MKKIIIYLLGMLFIVGFVLANAVTVSSNVPVAAGEQLEFTAEITSQSGVNLWKIKNIDVPASWTFVDKQFSGGSGPEHNELCGIEDDGEYGCNMFASDGSVVAKTVTLIYTVSSDTDNIDGVDGTWEIIGGGQVTDTGNIGGGTTTTSSNGGGNISWVVFAAIGIGAVVLFSRKK